MFQSLDWVERLSDAKGISSALTSFLFQSLDWVERLSDPPGRVAPLYKWHGFNPSTGLSVFQTLARCSRLRADFGFQSLDWVERLSDPRQPTPPTAERRFQSLDWVERLSDEHHERRHVVFR